MEETVEIRWDAVGYRDGYMKINMNQFFPCEISRLKKLVKLVQLDHLNDETIYAAIREHFKKRAAAAEEKSKDQKSKAAEFQTTVDEAKERIKAKTDAEGNRLNKETLKDWREKRDKAKEQAANALRDSDRALKEIKWFENNISILG